MKNVKILLGVFGFAAVMVVLFGWGLPVVFQLFLHNDYARSVILLVVFSLVVFGKRWNWSNGLVYIIALFSFFGMFIDSAGNPVYNKPLEWIVSSIGQLQLNQDVNNYAPGQYVISDNLAILKPGGEMVTLSTVWLYLYRLAQYMVLYSIIGTLLSAIRGKGPERLPLTSTSVDETLTPHMEQRVAAELKRREAASTSRKVVPEEIQEHVRQLKKDGQLIPAIKLVRQHTDMPLGEAKRYVEEM
ncbi:hypothetical protein NST04_26330 [Paenibacillus sp. FSL H7-0756]|uniref:hypothetical protein n=1 Tax=Paenibacillus sp. FSL H7-0756 TaxID=2954738 RepID=UPI0030F54528